MPMSKVIKMMSGGNGHISGVWCNSVISPLPLKNIPYNADFKIFYYLVGTERGKVTVGLFVDDELVDTRILDINVLNKARPYWFRYPLNHMELTKHTIQLKIGERIDHDIKWKYESEKYEVEVI